MWLMGLGWRIGGVEECGEWVGRRGGGVDEKYFFAFCLKYQKFYFNLWNIPCYDGAYINSQKSKLTKMDV